MVMETEISLHELFEKEGVAKVDADTLLNKWGITTVKDLRNCVEDKKELFGDIFPVLMEVDKDNKVVRKKALGNAHEEAVKIGINGKIMLEEEHKKTAEEALLKEREGAKLNELTVRAAEISAMKDYTETVRQTPLGKVQKVRVKCLE